MCAPYKLFKNTNNMDVNYLDAITSMITLLKV